MAHFLTNLEVEQLDGDNWRLLAPFGYKSDLRVEPIWVPKGTETDFASVPRLPVAYLLTGDTAHKPSVIHDWLYRNKIGKRAKADAIFYEAMGVIGVPWWRRQLMWAAVRAGGWATW